MNERLINDCCFEMAQDVLSIVLQLIPAADGSLRREVFAAAYEAARQRLIGYEVSRERLRQRLCEKDRTDAGRPV
jgi:hypothetical protein